MFIDFIRWLFNSNPGGYTPFANKGASLNNPPLKIIHQKRIIK